ncbi:hypothetical protein OC861_000705 [Tilletia horrida]|nr:hypothetical protein OC861_000705 [Tilletia horrida]
MLASATSSLRALALEPHKVPRKSGSLILIDVPARTDRSYPPALPRLPDQDKTPRPEIRRLRGSLSEMPSSDPDSLRVAHGSSPFKRRKLHSESDEEISTEDEDDEDSDEEADDSSMTRQDQAKAASAMEMSLRDHRTILGPDVKSVDENMTTLLAACGQKTFIPFSKVLTLLGAAPAPPRNKKGSSSHGKGSRTIVKIGEATYSEVFRLTTTVTSRSGDRKGKARDKEIETWEERKVLKIVPIRKDRPAENERKHMLPSIIAPTLTGNGKSRTDTESDNGEGTRRRGARDRAPTLKRKEADERGIEEMLAADAHKRKRARESAASDGPELSTARDVQREIEITRALGSLNPDGGAGGAFGSFVKLHAAHIVAGPYPKRLLDAWDDFHEAREGGSENWRPDVLEHNQVFAVIVLGDGGRNLEHSSLDSWQQAASIFWQLVHAIATAEMAIQFEHRDLHWGNVLISPRPPEIEPLRSAVLKEKQASALNVLTAPRSAARQAAPSLVSATTTVNFLANAADRGRRALLKNNNGPVSLARRSNSTPDAFARSLEAQHAGIYATIIDFALSRVVLEPGEGVRDEASDDEMEIRQKRILAYDFEDEEIFQGKGDPQFEVYRDMRDLVQGDWHTFRPITNVMWLSFFIGKLTETGKLKRPQIKNGKTYAGAEHRERYYYSFLRHCQRRIHTSVENVLEEAFDVRDANAKAARTGRPVEDFLPKANGKAGGDRDVEKKGGSKPLTSAKALLRWMRREVERLEDGYHAGEI